MWIYFPVKRTDGTAAGSVRAENGRTTLTILCPTEAAFTVFTAGKPLSVRPGESVPCAEPEAALGVLDGRVIFFGAAPQNKKPAEAYYAELSRIRTRKAESAAEQTAKSEKTVQKESETPSTVREYGPNMPQVSSNYGTETGQKDEEPEQKQTEESVLRENDIIAGNADSKRSEWDLTDAESPILQRAKAVYAEIETLNPPPVFTNDIPETGHSEAKTAQSGFDEPYNRDEKGIKDGTEALLRATEGNAELWNIDLFPRIFPGAKWRFVARDGVLPHFEGLWQHGGERVRILAVRGAYGLTPPPGLSGFTRYLRSDGAGYWVRILPLGK